MTVPNLENGTFKMPYKGLNVIIKRSDNYQYEELTNLKKSVSYTVKWINDCKYTLKPNNDLFKQYPHTPKNALITVNITSTKDNSYIQTSTSNFNKIIVTGEVVKIN